MNPSIEEILNALKESGYLFEQEVGTILEQNGYHIQTNAAFKDDDEEKSREIDVTGFRRLCYDERKKILIAVRILCECKNTQSPFVFINRNMNAADKEYCPPNFIFPQNDFLTPVVGKPTSYHSTPAFKHYNLDKHFPFHQNETKAVQFCKIFRKGKDWNASHDGIYDSILIPLIKCLEHYKKKDSRMLRGEFTYYSVYFPIVVINSEIYSIDSHVENSALKSSEFVSFIRDIDSKNLNGRFLVDFVTKDGLKNYLLNQVNPFLEKLKDEIFWSKNTY
jgi:hypothetical protein